MTERDQKWKEPMDSETTAFAARMEQEKQIFKATTNQTIKSYKAMKDCLHFENKTIKACCDSQAVPQTVMQQQITELLHQTEPIHPGSPNGLQPQARRTSNTNNNVKLTRLSFLKEQQQTSPQNLLESLMKSQKHQTQHRSLTQSRSLTAINETAQGISRHSPGQKTTTPATSYAKELTGGNKK
jgi:ATP-dependent Clp protease ATP-binding subunit ClpA